MPDSAPPSPVVRLTRPTRARRQTYFLRHFALSGSVGDAATRTGITPRSVQRWRTVNPAFARRYDEVVADRVAILEELAMRRASSVDYRVVFHRGRPVATVERHNDVMLMRVLARFDKQRLRSFDQDVERKVAARVQQLQSEFDLRVAEEVEKRMSQLSRSTRHAGSAVTGR